MGNNWFKFKEFTIFQDKCAMKAGTDAVILGAWCDTSSGSPCEILDIGTGTGILSLMMAQRSPSVQITAIEVDEDACEQAEENIAASPWRERITVLKADVRTYFPNKQFDIIISNPPFYDNETSCRTPSRDIARRTSSLSHKELIDATSRLMKENGHFNVVIPTVAESQFITHAIAAGLHPTHRTAIITKKTKAPKRVLLQFKLKARDYQEDTLTLFEDGKKPTKEYAYLTKDFYLCPNL